jgi:hypothetical protein
MGTVFLCGELGRKIVLPSIVRRIEIEERFQPFKAGDQILVVMFVFDNLLKPGFKSNLFARLFSECFQKILRGFVHQNFPELGAIILYQADALNHHVVDLPLSVL